MVAAITVDALSAGLQGLNVAQQLIDVTAQNISNASTAGYTRKTLQVNTEVSGGNVIGVTTGNIERTVDQSLQSTIWTETAQNSSQSTINTALSGLQSLYGSASAGTNFSSYLSNLNDDFTQLSATPNNTTLQQQVVTDAQTFSNSLNSTAQAITSARNDAENGIATSVASINTDLQQIAQLNTQIASTQSSGQSTADLEDQRDQAVQSLSQQIGISTYAGPNGTLVVQTANGVLLADTQAQTVNFQSQPVGANTVYPSSLSGITVGSNPGVEIAANPSTVGGTLGANLQLRDQILPQQQAQLDELSEQTASRFSAQGMKLFTDPSGNIPATTPASGYSGFSSTITVNPAVVSSPSLVQQGTSGVPISVDDNTVIQNVLNYTFGLNQNSSGIPNTPFTTTGLGAAGNISIASQLPAVSTLENFAQQVLTVQAGQASQYTSDSAFSSNYLTSLQTTYSNQTNVNLDTEVANLTVYQNAYSCSAQVVTTVKEMMTSLLDIFSNS
jgi:flagellar hook-associated protein 1 FlgK